MGKSAIRENLVLTVERDEWNEYNFDDMTFYFDVNVNQGARNVFSQRFTADFNLVCTCGARGANLPDLEPDDIKFVGILEEKGKTSVAGVEASVEMKCWKCGVDMSQTIKKVETFAVR